jgi:hypothetical protein
MSAAAIWQQPRIMADDKRVYQDLCLLLPGASILRVLRLTDNEQIRLRLDDHTQPFAKKSGGQSTNNIRTGFGGGISHLQSN